MLLLGGSEEMTYQVSGNTTFNTDFIGILPNGQKCSPYHDDTIPSINQYCGSDECVGVSYASRKGRWIYRCGGEKGSGNCKDFLYCNILTSGLMIFMFHPTYSK